MINIFRTEDFKKYPELHISIMNLVKDWLDKQTKLELKKGLYVKSNRKMYRVLYKRLSMTKVVDMLVEKQMRVFLAELLLENIYYHLIKHGDPKRYGEIIEMLKSGNKLKINRGYNLTSLLGFYLNITKNRVDDSIRKKNLKSSPLGEIDMFSRTKDLLDEMKKERFECTKKEALIIINKRFVVFSESLMNDKVFLNKLVNRYKQFEQREANKKIKKVNRITKG